MAYKVFANGFPLPASDLNNYLMRQSVMVFADAAARSAALTSPTEGMVAYTSDNNKTQYYDGAAWQDLSADTSTLIPKSTVTTTGDLIIANGNASVTRLGIGSNGQVLQSNGTTATWTTFAANAWNLLSTTSLTGSDVSINSISQSYTNLKIVISEYRTTNTADLYMYFRNGTTALTSWHMRSNTTGSGFANYQQGYLESPGSVASGEDLDLVFEINNYSSTTSGKTFMGFGAMDNTSTAGLGMMWLGGIRSDLAVDSFRLINSDTFSGGTVKIYGGN